MGYVAIKGGETAIEEAIKLLDFLRTQDSTESPLALETIRHQLHFLHSRVLSEGGLYHPELASLAIKQSAGDTLEAAFYLRAYRSTRPRLSETPLHNGKNMRLIRRISSTFKDIPGGQMLGPTPDYLQRLFRFELLEESPKQFRKIAKNWLKDIPEEALPTTFPKVLDTLRQEGLLPAVTEHHEPPFDITREPLVFPVPRSAALSTMARAETGSILSIAYSNMRGYGDIHPTVAELRVGYLPVQLAHPVTGELIEIGEVLMTECEVIAMYEADENKSKPTFGLGYGACFGHNEVKAIAMAILDRALQKGMKQGPNHPSEDPEFVLLHIDGIESMGFASHYKMPHYVTFQSDLDRLRTTQKNYEQK
ncbi:carbon-phosphorus lyase complex subunit PhnI [Iningainema tapete]|uniref:Carbon-phosphorus lyase complex subunit PhnI n=1 Tax=Iningainema tapete BLCC-T55 TaxID=2748662 RepID=A0A8J7BWZ2_9CYAN|nr:carbon-phosphorus lyase complex subunit PhnI [Iningainema tapete]MBD2772712.1 carbon-phosphorus lyase complex subunit PhnI [Iningainema tapete BLCC-T55]